MDEQCRIWEVLTVAGNNLPCGTCCCCEVESVVSDAVRPYRRQPTRLPRPWDSLGKNTGVGNVNISYYLTCTPEKAMAPHSSTLAWKIPWTEEPGRLQSMGSIRGGHD